jgi:hypothetical protein
VFKEHSQNIVGMILVKKLIVLDLDQEIAIKHLPLNSLPKVSRETPLFDMINEFQNGQSHMAAVIDPDSGLAVGVITLEDVIEEMIQEEIIDETDQYVDIHAKIKVSRTQESLPDKGKSMIDEEKKPLLSIGVESPRSSPIAAASSSRFNNQNRVVFSSHLESHKIKFSETENAESQVSDSEDNLMIDFPPESPARLFPEGFGKRRYGMSGVRSESVHSALLPFKKGVFMTLDTKPITRSQRRSLADVNKNS